MNEWLTEIPLEAGYYWFYGYLSSLFRDDPPELYVAEIKMIGTPSKRSNFAIIHGGFSYFKDLEGLWLPIEIPTLPLVEGWEPSRFAKN